MDLAVDADVVIKMTKTSLKETVVSSFTVLIPPEVAVECVEQGMAGGHPDALAVAGTRSGAESRAELTTALTQPSADDPIRPVHAHQQDDEAWYVREGALGFGLGEEVCEATAGGVVFGPRGVAHTYWNASDKPARYLIIMTSDTAAMIEELHAMEERSPETVRALFQRHQADLV